MRLYHLESFVRVLKLNPARRAIALRRMKEKLSGLPPSAVAALQPLMDRALQAQEAALSLVDAKRTHHDDTMHADDARTLDARLDRVLSMLYQALTGFIDLFGGEHAELAKKVRDEVFPDGVGGITGRPFVEQHELLNLTIRKLRSGEVWLAIAALKLDFWVDKLEAINAEYGAALTQPERVPIEVVREADHKGWLALVEVVGAVLGLYDSNSEADVAGRQRLLQPLVEQQQESALLRARRRHGAPDGEPADEGAREDSDEAGEVEAETAVPAEKGA